MTEGWWRFYNGAPHNPKLLKLSDKQFRFWANLVCFASENGGVLPPIEDVAAQLRLPPMKLKSILQELINAQLFDETETGLQPHNWSSRQYKSDVSTERVKRFRQRSRNGGGAPPGNVSETPPEDRIQKQNTETENKPDAVVSTAAREPPPPPALEEKLREAAGWERNPAPNLFVTGPIEALIAAGASLETDVLPVIRAKAPSLRGSPNWKYFVGPIQDAMADRAKAFNGAAGAHKATEDRAAEARKRIQEHNARAQHG